MNQRFSPAFESFTSSWSFGRAPRTVPALAILLICQALPVHSQQPPPNPAPYIEAIDRIDFLVGEWRGEGWTITGPNQRETFSSWEKVEKKLDGAALLIEGLHYATRDTKQTTPVHHALATISWSERDQKYRFVSALSNRDGGTFSGFVNDDGAFVWEIALPERRMRYVISIDEQGRWSEDGSLTSDGGKNWFPFFHMRLSKIASSAKK